MSAALKILHVAETAQGGVGSYLEEVTALQAELYGPDQIRVVMPNEHARHFGRLPPSALRGFDTGSGSRLLAMLRMTRLALQQVRRWQPDIVHLHSSFAGFALRPLLAALPHRPRIVYCAHGWAFDREGSARVNRAIAAVERLWSRWCDAVVCISRHDLDSARRAGLAEHRLTVVMNGIADLPATAEVEPAAINAAAAHWPGRGLRVLFVGRLDRQKGIDVLFEAMRRLGDRAGAVVVGSAVVADATQADMPGNVRVTGWLPRSQIDAYYRAAQVLVVPSRWEGFGLVALEGMRAGRAVIASRVGGLPEVVDDGVTGWLFDSMAVESPDGQLPAVRLAERLAELSDDQLQAMGQAGRRRFESLFDIRRVGAELDTLYRRLARRTEACLQGAT